jgi:hypothetical protein
MTDVFISYSRKDKEFVQTLHNALNKINREAWLDWEDIPLTAEWWQEIQRGIEATETFIFIITANSVASAVCRDEIEYAIKLHKRLVPIVRDDSFDKSQIHPALSKYNWLFFRSTDNFDEAFLSLIKALDTDLEHVRAHTRILIWAIQWDNKERSNDLILRGRDFEDATIWLERSLKGNKIPSPLDIIIDYIEASRMNDEYLKEVEQYNDLKNETMKDFVRGYLESRKKEIVQSIQEIKGSEYYQKMKTTSRLQIEEENLSIVQNLLGEQARWHPQKAILTGNTGAQADYVDVYTFPCCNRAVALDGDPSQFRADGCKESPS